MSKNPCQISRQQFVAAKALDVVIGGTPFVADVKHFSTGSMGWYVNGRTSHTFKTREEFKSAGGMNVTIDGKPFVADAKSFSTGSLGWYLNGKTTVEVAGVSVQVQIGLTLTIVDSKKGEANLDSRVQVGMSLTIVGSKELPMLTNAVVVEPKPAPAPVSKPEPKTQKSAAEQQPKSTVAFDWSLE